MSIYEVNHAQLRNVIISLLEIKDSDIRITTLRQCQNAIDKSIHIGGAFSSIIPFVTLFYGDIIKIDVSNPTKRGQDIFILSKGHCVASLASIYADLGYFDSSSLIKTRSICSMIKGHPGPVLPGVHVSTGPLGQGLGVAQGLALQGKSNPHFDVFCLTGDGELQEGIIWEAVMFSGYKKLDNLCMIIDANSGQLDDTKQLILPLPQLGKKIESFNWNVFEVDGTQYGPVLDALKTFKIGHRNGRPTAIICNTKKGFGGFSSSMSSHKATFSDAQVQQELELQIKQRKDRVSDFIRLYNDLIRPYNQQISIEDIVQFAAKLNLKVETDHGEILDVKPISPKSKLTAAPIRDKKINYNNQDIPILDKTKEYSASSIITQAMRIFAKDTRVVSIDADLASTSGLEAGVSYVDSSRALNVGVAEANMMNIAEAYAVTGHNVWISTFCPFFDWKVLRRIAIGYQERKEVIATKSGWLTPGHNLDITFLATAPNFETTTNGATHMGNDDLLIFDAMAHLNIIDCSCPNQLLGIMKWIMEGNKGLIYLRIMRAPSKVIYDERFNFQFGKGYILRQSNQDQAMIISSGRGVHEALIAADELNISGLGVGVVDMPSIDKDILIDLSKSGKYLIIAEQNNGYIIRHLKEFVFNDSKLIDTSRIISINALDSEGKPRFIHSGTYQELLQYCGLSSKQLVEKIKNILH